MYTFTFETFYIDSFPKYILTRSLLFKSALIPPSQKKICIFRILQKFLDGENFKQTHSIFVLFKGEKKTQTFPIFSARLSDEIKMKISEDGTH